MASAPVQPLPPAEARPSSARAQGQFLTPRFRQMVGALVGSGMALTLGIVAVEMVAPAGYRPSDAAATIEARVELGVMNQKLKMNPGMLILSEADYQRQIAEAQRQGQADAELEFQKKLAVVQADKERVSGAYQTLYQRTTMIVQMALQLEQISQQLRSRLLETTNGGRAMVIGFKDLFCGLGDPASCASASDDRRTMISEADELSRGDIGNRVRELMADIPDPATLIVEEDQRRNGVPAIER